MRDLVFAVMAFATILVPICGCPRPQSGHPVQPLYDAVAAGHRAVAEYDTNGDGTIAGTELDQCPGLKAAVDQIDPSGNRAIGSELITARMKTWERSKTGGLFIRCVVTHNGKPMPQVEVRFVPERFLGTKALCAIGKTDKDGVAWIGHPEFSEMGRQPFVLVGFYRVEITRKDENIPAKYNTKSVLGQEIAADAKGLSNDDDRTIRFDLEY